MTASITTSHARAERLRERMLDAAEAFLTARDRAAEANWAYAMAASELLSAKDANQEEAPSWAAAVREYDEQWAAAGRPTEEVPPVFARALSALTALEAAAGAGDPLRADAREETQRAVRRAHDILEELLEVQDDAIYAPLAPTLRAGLRAITRFMTALHSTGSLSRDAQVPITEVHASVARLALLFRREDDQPSPVVAEAERVKQDLLGALNAIPAAMCDDEPATSSDAFKLHSQKANERAIDFADAVNQRVRRRWRV